MFRTLSFPRLPLWTKFHFLIDRYQKQADRGEAAGRPWKEVMKRYIWRTVEVVEKFTFYAVHAQPELAREVEYKQHCHSGYG